MDLHGAPGREPQRPASNGRSCRRAHAMSPSACRSATTSRRWRAASIRATCPSCTAASSIAIRCTAAPRARTTSRTGSRNSRSSSRRAGFPSVSRRNAEAGHYYWRITQWIMPWYTMVPPYGDNALNAHAWVPIDDENCFTWTFTYHPTRPLSEMELDTMRKGGGIHVELVPGTFRPSHQQGQRLHDRPRRPEGAAAPTAASRASPCRTLPCRRAWGRSRTAPRRTWSPPTMRSSWRGIGCAGLRRCLAEWCGPPGPRRRKATACVPRSSSFPRCAVLQGQGARILTVKEGVAHTRSEPALSGCLCRGSCNAMAGRYCDSCARAAGAPAQGQGVHRHRRPGQGSGARPRGGSDEEGGRIVVADRIDASAAEAVAELRESTASRRPRRWSTWARSPVPRS